MDQTPASSCQVADRRPPQQRLAHEPLLRWAGQLHALAQAVEVEFDEVFPADYTTALCDQLWLRLSLSQ